jgi:hypothetical protein
MANGKMDEIKVWIQRAARWNKKDPEKILSRFVSSLPDNEQQTTDCSKSQQQTTDCSKSQQQTIDCSKSQQQTTDCSKSQQQTTDCSKSQQQTTDCSKSTDDAKYNILDIVRRKRILSISLIIWLTW